MSQVREIIEEYRLQRVLKTSTQSTVFHAADPETGEAVAIKLLSPAGSTASQESRERFIKTMETLQAAEITGVAKPIEFGFTPDESAFMVAKFIDTSPISQCVGSPPSRTFPLIAMILEGLDGLAKAGLSHLNLSLENVLVVDSPEGEAVLLTGLGSVAYLVEDGFSVLPEQNPDDDPHVAPERFQPGAVEQAEAWRADLFSAARVACDLLGAEVQGAATDAPVVKLAKASRVGVAATETLETLLAMALRGDTASREVSFAQLRETLISAMPAPPAAPRAAAETAAPPAGSIPLDSTVSMDSLPPSVIPADVTMAEPMPAVPQGGEAQGTLVDAVPPPPPPPGGAAPADATVISAQPIPPLSETGAGAAEPPSPPIPPPAPGAAPTEPAPVARPVPELTADRSRIPLLVGLAVGSVVLLFVVRALVPGPGSWPQPEPAPTPVAVLPTPAPTPVPTPEPVAPAIHPQLELADNLLVEGDPEAALEALGTLTEEEVAAFSAEETEVFEELQSVLEGSDLEQAAVDLRGGLQHGSVKMLKRAVSALSGLDEADLAADRELRRLLERGREALRAHRLLWRAHGEGDHLQVLERAAAVIEVLPGYSGAPRLREEAAAAMEALAEDAARTRQWNRAVEVLQAVRQRWPERVGLGARIARYRSQMAGEQRVQQSLQEARAKGQAGDPEGGLGILAGLSASGSYASQVAELRRRLEAQLADLDAQPPRVALPSGFELVFRKNKPIVVPFQITDDYRVVSAKVRYRTESKPQYRDVQLSVAADGAYNWNVTQAIHGNEDVSFYVEATDRSGQTARFGTRQEPLELKKKRWFK